ncbi:hypothetical protein [Sphingobium algorifonticola]|uniref:Uncharacterized protein n=1 Tax=Sphingobium algorifonticola TaxID=2008318 RepID=A0A437JD19_9SPHN|nr:hypothetical protein [Sphingobium algorifonticola]RVT43781.1 hypothetical protein ENE74_04055 [Sphingobium algorifonticola]
MKRSLPMLMLPVALAACSDSRDVMEELPNSSIAGAPREAMPETQIESTLARPVTIGEDGPQLDACGALGLVRGVAAGKRLAVHAAPFREAKATAQLGNGARVHVCTRSLDQKWLGVVVMPDAPAPDGNEVGGNAALPAPVDCGVSSPVDRRQAYDGPCQSGWVSSGFVRLIAG